MLHHSAYVLSKLILRLSEEFEIMISTKTVYSLQNFCGLKWRIWAIRWVLRWLFTTQEARVEMSFSIAKQIFTQKFESPGFQIEHQINWKADAFSRAIQSKIHQKSKCEPANNFREMQLSKTRSILGWDFVCQGAAVTLFAPSWLDTFFTIIQSAWSNSVTAEELSRCHKRY